MKLRVRVHPNSREDLVEKLPDGTLSVRVKAPPVDGKANAALVSALASHFGVAKSKVRIVSGAGSRSKIVEISEDGQ